MYEDNQDSSHSFEKYVAAEWWIAVRLRPLDAILTAPTLSRRSLVPCCFSVVGFGLAYLGFVVLPRSSATGTPISPFKPE